MSCLSGENKKRVRRIRCIRCGNAISTRHPAGGKPQKMHRLCGTRKRKESSAVGRFGSINYLTKPPPARRSPPPRPPARSPPSNHPPLPPLLCRRFSPEASSARSVYVSIPCTTPPPFLSVSLSAFLLLRVDTLVDPASRPRSEISS